MSSTTTTPETKTVLVIGATGKQGRAFIRSLLFPSAASTPSSPTTTTFPRSQAENWRILALTRDASAPPSQALLEEAKQHNAKSKITLVEACLNTPSTLRTVFESHPNIYSVFVVLAYPGLGTPSTAQKEKAQGILIADLAVEFGVNILVYSSAIPIGPDPSHGIDESRKQKREVEYYIEDLGKKNPGLKWIVIRPGFFYENLEGMFGAIGATMYRDGLKKETTLPMVASGDLGRVVAGLLQNPEPYFNQFLCVTSGPMTMREVLEAHRRATGKPMPAAPGFVGWILLKINKGAQDLVKEAEINHANRMSGKLPTFEEEVERAKSVCELQTYEQWKRALASGEGGGDEMSRRVSTSSWNNLSLMKLLTGRS
ncbi:uncharacterized protein PODANS_7_755 [Podospora anserina S mat+]|uniref:Podospora anserina S mat+ genomic DNA chromosome 7, supercontig 3 n=1 Tax=Podospora anserina (strain S / ATCC MYA-4624 / DSM 980 / FGSC 10383) TaxID=515849 RepID=B2AP16_PODAN|nr:uncharacterized protein PODANS_7_755 [Podospora anserina S mat+]CAP65721.1 unnamed protein product [Podospora anserina S mat+]CDP32781.1 Putative protein of unknown function [Podospora anserina S mat+]